MILAGIRNNTLFNGGRIAFGRADCRTPERARPGIPRRTQDLGDPNGKMLRMNPEAAEQGSNHFPESVVYSHGHRNVQGPAGDSYGFLYGVRRRRDAEMAGGLGNGVERRRETVRNAGAAVK